MKITVLIVDPMPIAILQQPATVRRVTIDLTEAQERALKLNQTGTDCGNGIFEYHSQAFVEVEEPTNER